MNLFKRLKGITRCLGTQHVMSIGIELMIMMSIFILPNMSHASEEGDKCVRLLLAGEREGRKENNPYNIKQREFCGVVFLSLGMMDRGVKCFDALGIMDGYGSIDLKETKIMIEKFKNDFKRICASGFVDLKALEK